MNTNVAVAPDLPARIVPTADRIRPTLSGALRGEWIKLTSLRSTWWLMAATVVLMTLVSVALAWSFDAVAANPLTAPTLAAANSAELMSGGFQMGMMTIAVLGVLLVTADYSTGTIRATFAAVPTRVPVLVAKAVVLAAATAVSATLGILVSYLVTKPKLAQYGLVPALDEARTWQVFGGTVFFLIASALLALGAGTVLRSSAGAIVVALTVLLVLPGVLRLIDLDWIQAVADYLPLPASAAFLGGDGRSMSSGSAALSPAGGLLVVAAYALAPLIAGATVLRRRDA